MPENEFHVNEFRTYEVQVEGVSFGFIDTGAGGYNPALGEKFQYDGTTVVLKDGREFNDVPQLRSAITEGWCVQVGGKVSRRGPRSANIQVRATTQRGSERVAKAVPQMEMAEEDVIVSVDDRRRRREEANEDAVRRVPLESDEGKKVMAKHWDSGDEEVNEIADLLSGEMDEWLRAQEEEAQAEELDEEEEDPEEEIRARAEADILSLFALVEEDPDETLRAESRARRAKKKAAKKKRASRPRAPASDLSSASTSDLRTLPVDHPDEQLSMPIVREEAMENVGTVVGSVVEREEDIALDVAPARPPQSPRPSPRLGGTGAIVVDEQRHMGDIALSSSAAPIQLDESAKVKPNSTESIKMGDVEVGGRKKVARAAVETDQGVAVGRILSPAKRDFVADDRNTSSTAIQRTEEGKRVQIEKFEVEGDEEVVGDAENPEPRTVATGDVEEARGGDELEELLPDAAQGPRPEVHRRPEDDPAYDAVKMMIPGFEWDKDRPVKERVADALKRVKEPMYVKGILAVETEVAREEIKKGLADLLAKQRKQEKASKAKNAS